MPVPGFEVVEVDPLDVDGFRWRGLRTRFPRAIASCCGERDVCFGEDGLLAWPQTTLRVPRPKKKGLAEAKPLNWLVETRRIELLTFALRTRRSPS